MWGLSHPGEESMGRDGRDCTSLEVLKHRRQWKKTDPAKLMSLQWLVFAVWEEGTEGLMGWVLSDMAAKMGSSKLVEN